MKDGLTVTCPVCKETYEAKKCRSKAAVCCEYGGACFEPLPNDLRKAIYHREANEPTTKGDTMKAFEQGFDSYVCEGDTITATIDGVEYTARIERDIDTNIDDDDCHNTDQSVTGCDDEQFAKLLEARESWKRDEWFYCGVVISATKGGVNLGDHLCSLWAIEANYPNNNNNHLLDVANELIEGAVVGVNESIERIKAAIL